MSPELRVQPSLKPHTLEGRLRVYVKEGGSARLVRRTLDPVEEGSGGTLCIDLAWIDDDASRPHDVDVEGAPSQGNAEVFLLRRRVSGDENQLEAVLSRRSEAEANDWTVAWVERGLPSGVVQVYTTIAKALAPRWAAATPSANFGGAERLYASLPAALRDLDGAGESGGRKPLRSFLAVFGGALDYLRGRLENDRARLDLRHASPDLLPRFAALLGWPDVHVEAAASLRRDLQAAPKIYGQIGTERGLKALIYRWTGVVPTIERAASQVLTTWSPEDREPATWQRVAGRGLPPARSDVPSDGDGLFHELARGRWRVVHIKDGVRRVLTGAGEGWEIPGATSLSEAPIAVSRGRAWRLTRLLPERLDPSATAYSSEPLGLPLDHDVRAASEFTAQSGARWTVWLSRHDGHGMLWAQEAAADGVRSSPSLISDPRDDVTSFVVVDDPTAREHSVVFSARPSARPHRGGRGVDEPTLLRRALTSERPAQTQVIDADDRGLWRRMERVEVLAALARPQRAAPNVGEGVPVRRPAELIIGGHARVDRRWVLWFRMGDGPLEIWPPAPAQARDLRLRLEGDALIATWSAGAAAPATMAGGEPLFDADAQSGATVTVRLHPPSDTADADAWARDLERRLEPFRPVHVRYRVVAI